MACLPKCVCPCSLSLVKKFFWVAALLVCSRATRSTDMLRSHALLRACMRGSRRYWENRGHLSAGAVASTKRSWLDGLDLDGTSAQILRAHLCSRSSIGASPFVASGPRLLAHRANGPPTRQWSLGLDLARTPGAGAWLAWVFS